MTTGAQQPPPGWYDDPEATGRQRWWNGSAWTEHHREASGAAGWGSSGQSGPGTWTPGATGSGVDDRTWIVLAHASALLAAWVGLAFVGPLLVYLLRRDASPEVRAHAAAALNFQLSWLIWGIALGIVTVLLSIILIGVLLIPVLLIGAVAWLVITIVASVRASQGGPPMAYPLTIRFVD